MSIMNGLEYINNTKRNIRSRMQGKGVPVVDTTPFRKYPELLDENLENKKWQYPTSWYQLTPKAEIPNGTLELILLDVEYDFKFKIVTQDTSNNYVATFKMEGHGGSYYIDDTEYLIGQEYTLATNKVLTFRLVKDTGIPSDEEYSTLRLKISAFRITSFQTYGNNISPLLALRLKELNSNTTYIHLENKCSFLKYLDLSQVLNLTTSNRSFVLATQLIKAEFRPDYTLSPGAFYKCYNLRELEGVDFESIVYADQVFGSCHSFTPPSLNYLGKYSYAETCLIGEYKLPDGVTLFPASSFLSPVNEHKGRNADNAMCNLFTIKLKGITSMYQNSLCSVTSRSDCIVEFDDEEQNVTIQNVPTDKPAFSWGNAMFQSPYLIKNGDNFIPDKPVALSIQSSVYAEEVVNMRNTKLSYLTLGVNGGKIKEIHFDWDNSDFEVFSDSIVIDIPNNKLTKNSLVYIFEHLPDLTDKTTKTIRVSGNAGAIELTDIDLKIATDKNWIVIK